eukprot:403331664
MLTTQQKISFINKYDNDNFDGAAGMIGTFQIGDTIEEDNNNELEDEVELIECLNQKNQDDTIMDKNSDNIEFDEIQIKNSQINSKRNFDKKSSSSSVDSCTSSVEDEENTLMHMNKIQKPQNEQQLLTHGVTSTNNSIQRIQNIMNQSNQSPKHKLVSPPKQNLYYQKQLSPRYQRFDARSFLLPNSTKNSIIDKQQTSRSFLVPSLGFGMTINNNKQQHIQSDFDKNSMLSNSNMNKVDSNRNSSQNNTQKQYFQQTSPRSNIKQTFLKQNEVVPKQHKTQEIKQINKTSRLGNQNIRYSEVQDSLKQSIERNSQHLDDLNNHSEYGHLAIFKSPRDQQVKPNQSLTKDYQLNSFIIQDQQFPYKSNNIDDKLIKMGKNGLQHTIDYKLFNKKHSSIQVVDRNIQRALQSNHQVENAYMPLLWMQRQSQSQNPPLRQNSSQRRKPNFFNLRIKDAVQPKIQINNQDLVVQSSQDIQYTDQDPQVFNEDVTEVQVFQTHPGEFDYKELQEFIKLEQESQRQSKNLDKKDNFMIRDSLQQQQKRHESYEPVYTSQNRENSSQQKNQMMHPLQGFLRIPTNGSKGYKRNSQLMNHNKSNKSNQSGQSIQRQPKIFKEDLLYKNNRNKNQDYTIYDSRELVSKSKKQQHNIATMKESEIQSHDLDLLSYLHNPNKIKLRKIQLKQVVHNKQHFTQKQFCWNQLKAKN